MDECERTSKINALFLNLKIKWLLVVQDYFGGTIGPLLGVKDRPCFNCLMKRKYSNMPRVDMYLKLEEYFDNAKLAESSILLIQEGLANKVGIEIFKVMTNIVYPKVYRGLYEFDILNHDQSIMKYWLLRSVKSVAEYKNASNRNNK